MSRKTRKLIWSVPLVAVFAVAGALAMFMTLQPNEAAAQQMEPTLPGMVQDLTAAPHTDGTPQTELLVMWEEPTDGAPTTSYRIDISDDGDRWFSHVTDHGDGDLRLVYEGLKPTATKHFRVFALNEDLEAGPGTDTMGTTSASTNPMKPTSLTATQAGATTIVAAALDLNGDGDATDTAVDEISEATVGVDLNGDGDINDTLDEVDEKVAKLNLDGVAGNTVVDTFDETTIMSRVLPGDDAVHSRTVIRLNWTAPEDPPGAPVKYYRIQYRVGQGSWRTLADKAVPHTNADGGKVWYHSGLNADVTRQYQVFAQNEPRGPGNRVGMSGPSDGATGSTATSLAPAVSTDPVIGLSPAATDVHLKWTAPADPAGDPVSHYRVQARLANQTPDEAEFKNLHTGKHIDRTNVYNFGGVDLKNAGITVPQNIVAAGLVVDIRIAAINRANTDATDAEITAGDPNGAWLTLEDVPVGHHGAPKRAGTPTVKRDNDRHQGRSGLNVTWPTAEFIEGGTPTTFDTEVQYIIVIDDDEVATAINHGPAATIGTALAMGGDLTKPGYDDDGLKTETTKAYQVYAINTVVNALVSNASVRSFPSGKASLATSRPTKPGMPGTFAVVPDGHTEIKVSWTTPLMAAVTPDTECGGTTQTDQSDDGSECGASVITGYKIQRAPVNSDGQAGRFTDLTTVKANNLSYTDTDLEPNSSYFYQVFAMNSQRDSDPTAPKSATTHPAGEPTPPGGLVAQAGDAGEIKLCWYEQNVPNPQGQTDEGLPVIGYRIVYLGGDDGKTEMPLAENTMSKNTEYTATGLMPDTEYTFRVYSITLGGVGTKYDEASATTDAAPPNNAPMAGDAIPAQTVAVGGMVDVDSTITDGDGDTLTWSVDDGDGTYATAEVDTMGKVTITGVMATMANMPATITVTAMDADGSGMSASQDIMVTVTGDPIRPTITSVSTLQNSITVAWDPASIQPNAEVVKVALFDLDAGGDIFRLAMGYDGNVASYSPSAAISNSTHTFTNVPDGTYKVGVANFANGVHRTIISGSVTVPAP